MKLTEAILDVRQGYVVSVTGLMDKVLEHNPKAREFDVLIPTQPPHHLKILATHLRKQQHTDPTLRTWAGACPVIVGEREQWPPVVNPERV